jgi:lipopolysaccharide/colanic/teichoic acid biosynthesis glycosyltransferase
MAEFFSGFWGILTLCAACAVALFLLSVIFYRAFFKRFYDLIFGFLGLVLLSPVLLILALLVRIKLGKPIIFCQIRPGMSGKLFRLHKFRTMTDARGSDGALLPDSERLTKFGSFLRRTSLDELPEIWDIFRGKMSLIGPRPQLVKDLVFMSESVRRRHAVRPGLTGLAQVSGRNNVEWNERFAYDLQYVESVSLFNDVKIFFKTAGKVLKRADVQTEGMATSEDYGDWLLRRGGITQEEYDAGQAAAATYIKL